MRKLFSKDLESFRSMMSQILLQLRLLVLTFRGRKVMMIQWIKIQYWNLLRCKRGLLKNLLSREDLLGSKKLYKKQRNMQPLQEPLEKAKRPQRFASYVALVSNISDTEPSLFDEANKLQVWKDAMLDEYKSIMKNSVWDSSQA
jgi:hypothetical protein